MTTWAEEVCEPCEGRGWVPKYVMRQVARYVGDFGNDERPAKSKWKLKGPREVASVEVMEAEPCPSCNSKLHDALLQGRLLAAMKERNKPLSKEAQRERNKARVKKEFDL